MNNAIIPIRITSSPQALADSESFLPNGFPTKFNEADNEHEYSLEKLINTGADVKTTNESGWTPLKLTNNDDIKTLLLQARATT